MRAKYRFTPSDDIIYEQCKTMLNVTTAKGENRFKKSNIIQEMPDEFIRKMRLTGLISIRGNGCFIDFNNFGIILFEVTLLTGTRQNIREMPAIQRHLEEVVKTVPESFSVMICPRVHTDTISYSRWLKDTKKLVVVILETKTFVESLDAEKNARQYSNT